MRTFVMTLLSIFSSAVLARATNIALPIDGATVTTNSSIAALGWSASVGGNITYFPASDAIDGTGCPQASCAPLNEWVAPGGTVQPYLLINLGSTYAVDYLTVSGVGNPGLSTSFDVFVSENNPVAALNCISSLTGPETSATSAICLSTIESTMTLALSVLNQQDGGSGWTTPQGSVSTATPTQYVLYYAVDSSTNCPIAGCFPGNGITSTQIGQEDAFATSIVVDAVPEPATFGLFSAALLAFGLVRRFRQQSC